MKKLLTTLALALFLPVSAHAESALCGTELKSIDGLEKTLQMQGLPGRSSKDEKFNVYIDERNNRSWSFTTPKHPAHSSVACRYMEKTKNDLILKTDLMCSGSQKACADLKADFKKMDAAAQAALQKSAQKKTAEKAPAKKE